MPNPPVYCCLMIVAIGGIAAVMVAAPAAAAPFVEARSNFFMELTDGTGDPIPPGLALMCNGVPSAFCADEIRVAHTVVADEQYSVSRRTIVTLANTGADPTGFFGLSVFWSLFNPGGPWIGLSLDNTHQSAALDSNVQIDFPTNPFKFDFICSLPGAPGTQGSDNSRLFSATECGQEAPDESDFLPGLRFDSLAPGESISFDCDLTISDRFSAIPEPSTLVLLIPPILALGLRRRLGGQAAPRLLTTPLHGMP